MQMQDCLFCRMGRGEIQVEKVAQNPRAPIHCLIIPKVHVDSAREFEWNHTEMLAGVFMLAKDVARVEGVWESGYRLAFNVGDAAGMTVHHLHLHLLGGRMLGPEG